jgi:hypothetical protein
MANADTTPGRIYDIAEQLGYEGARTQSSAKGVYACADALGFVGPHARRITDALSDLKTVVGGGGGGVTLGELTYIFMLDAEPVVDSALSTSDYAFSHIMVGDSVAAEVNDGFASIAGGVKAYGWLYAENETANITVAAWAITFEASGHDNVCKSRRALTADCGVVYGDPLSQGESATWMYLIVPDPSPLADGEMFAFSIVESST